MRGRSPSSTGLLAGPHALVDALHTLRVERSLWLWCLLPALVNAVAFALAAFALLHWLGPWVEVLRTWLDVAEPAAWYGWLWVAPLRALAWLVRCLALLFAAALLYVAFTLLAGVLASPFLDALSERVERLARGGQPPPGPTGGLWRTALRSVREELKRVLFFAALQLSLLALGLVPGLQPFAVAGLAISAALFLPLDYTGFALDRRSVAFRERRRWLWRHRSAMLGFGGSAMVTFLIPGLNFFCLPWLVTAGTLLALRVGPPQALPADSPAD